MKRVILATLVRMLVFLAMSGMGRSCAWAGQVAATGGDGEQVANPEGKWVLFVGISNNHCIDLCT